MRKFILLTTFFTTITIVFLFTLVFTLYRSYHHAGYAQNDSSYRSVAYAALPSAENLFEYTITEEEGRVEKIKQFLHRYSSPLEEHADLIVQVADGYNLDYRLIPAIAMQESNLCRRIPEDSHNCWGFGIYGKKVTRFENYPQAIETITKTLATKYRDKGLITPVEIMSMYTPSSDGSWAKSVAHFMNQI